MKSKARSPFAWMKRPAKVLERARFDGQLEELEPRILFSADAAALLADPTATPAADLSGAIQQVIPPAAPVQTSTPDQTQAQAASGTQANAAHTSTELVFVDARVPDAQKLMQQILAQQDGTHTLEIHWLSADQDGVTQITQTLQGRHDVSALHIISHGSDGNVQLGSTWLNEATLPSHLQALSSWQSALTADADILIYGCDVAQTAAGQHFVNDLALLTGADVAASENKTGSAALGGDWSLEYQVGLVQSFLFQPSSTFPQWNHVLDTVTLRDGLNGYTGTTDTYLSMLNLTTDYSTSTTLSAGRSTTQDPFQTLLKFENLAGSGTNQVPQGSTVTSVTLTLYMTSSPTFTNPTFSMYKMLAAWTDTDTYSSMGSGVDGAEYQATADMSFTDNGTGSYVFTFSSAGNAMIATVQSWIDNPGSNQGWYLFCNDNSSKASFASSENGTTANRPSLAITYTPPTPPSMDLDANNSSGATGNNYSGAFVENSPAVKVADSDATITAGSTSSLTGMTVTLGAVPDGAAESLAATTSGTNITASYSAGVLTLSGTDTAANYQSVLRSITYNNTSDTPNTTARSLTIVLTDANGKTATATSTLSVTATNDPPVITSNGGGATASISVAETLTAVTTVTSTDPEGTARTYSIVAGGDGAKFSINSSTGVLTFVTAPDYEAPTDSNADNVYVVTVQASDGSLTDTQTISVTVTDVSSALVVTTTADTNDSGLGSSFTAEQLNAVNGGSDGKVSLREAIIAANTTAGTDTISFAITGATGSYGEYTITATSALPTITQAVNINAATQSGYVAGGVHTVVLDGNDAAAYGLDLSNTADGSTIRGLVIRNFTSYGIYVESGSDNNTIVGNFIGSFNADGSNKGVGFGNATAGIVTYGANTVIGGTTAADRNVISGNPGGYNIYMATGADGTVIKGNYIGLNAAGTSVFSTTNPNYGIMIETSSTNVTIGGTAAGSGNVISGHTREGIWVTTTGAVTIQGNYIGTDVTGTVDLGNTRYGIYLDDAGTATIGGTTAGAGNLISGNDLGGIYAANNSVTVLGNIIGLNATGTAKLANTGSGIELRTGSASTIGGNGSGYRNIISGNAAYGIDVETSNAHVIKGNYIGVGADGVTLLGNTLAGVYINATGTIVGGKTSGDGNIIAGNGGAGIAVAGGTGNLFYRNSIYSNTGIGIDLGNDGVTANDYNDGDGGANYSNNYPVITSVVTNGTSTTITGSIDWHQGPDTIYIELFSSPTKDATGYGQGKTYLGAAQVTTTAGTGDATFSLTVTGVSVGDWVSAVANIETSFIGASEFSKAVQAVAPANAPRGRVIWNNNDRFYQSYADWSSAGFGGIGTDGLSFSDDISMITAAEAPTRNEILFIGSADASGKILAGIWNGSTWSSVLSIPIASPSASAQNYDSFALAYDPVSGDAMMVWDNGNTGTTGLSYATWNGTSWSAINTITAPVSGEPLHMKLAAKPNSHEMMLAVETNAASNNQYAIVWNGSSWGNAQTLGTNSNEQYFELNVAYEQQSGKAMVIYDNSASNSPNVQYRTWNGSAWSSEGTITAPAGVTATSDLYNTAIASDPGSNRIAIAAKDAANETWLAVWDGSSWGSTLLATTSGVDTPDHHATMAVAFESQSGDLLTVYGKSAGPNVYYRTWTSGGGWSAEGTGPSVGGTDIPYISKLYADPYSNTIMLGVQDNAYDLNFVAWDGSVWGSVTELDNNTVFYYRENFTYVWYQNAPLISNLSGDTLAFTEDQAAQVIDQGTSAAVTLGDQTLYNGGNLTVSLTAGSTATEDVLAIRNQGTGAGQIGISGGNVTYAGTVIGTYTGGTGGVSLVITFNSNATDAAVTALVKNITYQNTNTSTPSTSTRTVRFVVTNALGQASANNDVSVTVASVNDAPVNTVPAAQSVNEDTTLVFSSGNSNLISIADVDAGSSNVQVTLTVTNGTLTLSGITGLSFTVGDGTADTTMTFTGTVSAINTALAGMGYSPTANYNGSASLTIVTSDLGNTGSGGTLTDTDVVNITVNAVNDAPVNSVPTAQTTNEDTNLTFSSGNGNLISISDVDAASGNMQVTLSVSNGTLTLSGLTGLSFTSGDGTADATMTFTGTASAINTALAGLVYTPTANYNGSDTLTIATSDLGNTGSGGAKTDTDTVAITVTAVNDAPVNTVPAAQSVNEDSTLTFSSGNSNLISIADVDAGSGSMQVTISVSHGALTLSGTTGLSFTSGDGTADATMTFTGTASAINTALAGLVYTPTANYNGSDTLTILTSDQGNAGSGGAKTDTDTVAITVNAVNDAPVNTVPAAQSVNEDTNLTFSTGNGNRISIADVDAAGGNMQVTLSVSNGTLTLSGLTGLSFTSGDGTADATMTFTGTASAINTALAGLVYTPNANYNGSDTLTILTSDLGNTGSGGTLTDSDTVAITVNAVNDAPVATITPISYNATEQVGLALQGTGLSISDIDAGGSNVQATLSVTSGTLTVSAGSTGVVVSGSTTNTITLTGTLTQINDLLAGNGGATLSYIINSDAPPASDTLTLLASDLGNTGTGGTLTGSDTAAINITPVNDAPSVSITAPSYSVVQAQNLLLHNTGLSVTDPDGSSTSVQVTLSADLGTLTVAAGTSGVSVGGSGTGSVTLSGTVAQINNLLQGNAGATVSYINDSGTPTASATLTLAIDDLGNTGGGNLTASGNVAINVVPAAAMGSVAIPGVPPTDISAYYGFDANANLGRDDAPGGHDMTLIGSPTPVLGHDGRTSGFGVTNDETGAAPQTGGNIAGLSTGGAMTISLWVKFDSFNDASGGFDRVIDFGQAGATGIGNIVLARSGTSQQMSFMLQHDNLNQDVCTTALADVVQTGQWAYIACTVDNAGTMNIYFNGQLSGTFNGTALATGVRTNNYVAQSNWAGSYGMNGAIDDLLVANRAMTATEIAALYNQSNGLNVYEKAANGTTVGTVVDGSSIDGRTVTYSLTNSAAGRFAINSSTGEITVADSANLLYADASHYTLTVRATDSGGFALDTNYTVNLLNINDAPVGTSHTVGAVEDTPYVFGTSDFGFTDPSDPSANSLLAVKITAVPASGTLTLNGVAVSANDVIQASDIAAGKLQFTAAANANGTGYASFDFKVQDDGGTAHGGADTDATARTMTIDVTSVNDAPQGSDKTVTTLEDTPYVFSTSDFGFSDVDGNAFFGLKITSVPAAGSLTLNGVAVSANDVILASDIAAGHLQLTPAANANGTGYSSLQFKVQDDGGTANGGVNLDASARTMTLDVTPVNDAPAGADKTVSTNEDTSYVFSASDFGFTDPDDSPANSLQAVKLTTLPASGTLTLNGSAVSVGQLVSVTDINAGLLVFAPAANANGMVYATLGFQVQDNGGTANGGVNLDATTRTLTINVTAVNDAPTTQDEAVSGNEDTVITGAVSGADVDGNPLSFSKGSDPTHGIVSVAANGSFSYTPNANYNGTDSFTVTVSDGQGGTATSTVTVTINPVNDAPTANNPSVSGNEDTVITGQVTASDVENDPLSFNKASDPTHGSVTVNSDGSFSYTPTANYNGTDSFTVTVSDGQGGTTTSTINVTIAPVNDAPTANNVSVSGNEDTAISGQVTGADVDGNPLSYTKASDPTHGSVSVAANGNFVYTPNANYNGTDSFTVTVSDGQGGTATATVNVTIAAVNDAPTADNPGVVGAEDTTITGQVTGADVDGDTLSYTRTSNPTHGSVIVNSDGSFSYTPAANFNGSDSFTVTVSDGQGGSVLSTVSITVTPVNDAPVSNNPSVSGAEDTVITGAITASDVEGDTLSYQISSDATHGQVTVASDGSFSYTPTANYNGTDSFAVLVSDGQGGTTTSTVSVSITPVNDAPTTQDVNASGAEDNVITGQVTGSDVDGNSLSYTKGSDPTHGSVTVQADGSFSYTPTANYNGTDSFTVTVSDGQGGSATSTVSIAVTPVNDAPTTGDVIASGAEDTPITGQVSGSDVDGDTLSYTKGSNPAHGSVVVNGDGSFIYTPTANFNGSDSFTVTVSDGQGGTATSTVAITVTPVNDVPVTYNIAVSGAEDTAITGQVTGTDADNNALSYTKGSDPTHGSVTVNNDGSFSYTPTANFNGNDSFTVTVSDGLGGTATSTVSITVTPVNDAPVTGNVTTSGAEDTTITGQVNGSDVDGDALSYTRGSNPTHGSVTVNTDGSFSYTPTANYNGTDSFTVLVSDGQGGTATSTVSITITPVNDAPTAANVVTSGAEDTTITGQVIGSDVDGDTLSYTKGSNPTHGSVTVNTDGSFSYTPTANFNGGDSFTVTVSDGQGGTTTSTVSITVTPVNDAPVTGNVTASGAEDTTITGQVTGTDVDGDTLSYAKGGNPTHGSVTVNTDGGFSYTPTANYNGSDSFTVLVTDGLGGTATSTVTITVTPVADNPIMSANTLSATAAPSVTWASSSLLNGASDPDGGTLAVRIVQGPQHGSLAMASNGQLTYTATTGYSGPDSFIYEAFDGQLASSNTRMMAIQVSTPQPVLPISTPPSADTTTSSPDTATPDTTSATKPTAEPSTVETKPGPSAPPATVAKPRPETSPSEPEAAPATALHERVQAGAWFGARPADNGTAARQILFTGTSRDYFSNTTWTNTSNNSVVTQLLDLIKPTLERAQDINLMLTPLSSVAHALPAQGGAEATSTTQDGEELGPRIHLTKVASYSTGLGLSIGTIWWTARISGLVTSALVSTPAWRSLDPLPVVTSPADDPDHDEDGDNRLGDREVEHLFDGDKPIEQDMPVIQ